MDFHRFPLIFCDFEKSLGCFGVTLGSLWGHFGVLWDHFGVTLGSLWDYVGVTLGHFGVTLGI